MQKEGTENQDFLSLKLQRRFEKMINIKTEKKDLWLLAAVMVFVVGIGYVIAYSSPIPNPGHGGDNVYININGNNKDLQTAINDNEFSRCPLTGGSFFGTIINGHRGEEVTVNVNGTIKSFQGAINDISLSYAEKGKSPSNFESINYGQTGNQVLINIGGQEKTLQQAINNSDLSSCCGNKNLASSTNSAIPSFNKINLGGSAGGVSWLGSASDLNDNNNNTYIGFGNVIPPYGDDYIGEFEGIVNFPSTAREITKVYYNLSGYTDGRVTDWIVRVYLKQGGSWNQIDSRKSGSYEGVSINGNWYNVEGVKVYVWAVVSSQCLPAAGCSFYRHLREIEAWGYYC